MILHQVRWCTARLNTEVLSPNCEPNVSQLIAPVHGRTPAAAMGGPTVWLQATYLAPWLLVPPPPPRVLLSRAGAANAIHT